VADKALGNDPLAGLGTPGERNEAEGRAQILAIHRDVDPSGPPPGEPPETGSPKGGGRARWDNRLATLERRVDRALRSIRQEVPAPDADRERERLLRSLRDLNERLDAIASATAKLAQERRGFFRRARGIARRAGDLVSPDYYGKILGEFGLRDRSSRVDEFGMDPVYRESMKPLIEFLYRRWWRVRIEGIASIPVRGPALLVGNHAGVIPLDAMIVSYAIESRHAAKRRVRFMIEDWFATLPFANPLLARAGAARAHRENAERLLRTGHLVGAFPEGTKGSLKYYRDRYRVQRFGRGGSVRLAMRTGAPIIPFAVVGSEEIYPVIAKANWLARLLGMGELPVAANAVLGPLGVIPLPSKWIIHFDEPIDMSRYGPADAENDMLVNDLTDRLRRTVQERVDQLLTKRKSPWRG
jgi:1-acyl-sn-glycerol-3-phosphate acyltransferase